MNRTCTTKNNYWKQNPKGKRRENKEIQKAKKKNQKKLHTQKKLQPKRVKTTPTLPVADVSIICCYQPPTNTSTP